MMVQNLVLLDFNLLNGLFNFNTKHIILKVQIPPIPFGSYSDPF